MTHSDLRTRMREQLQAVQATVQELRTMDEAFEYVVQLTQNRHGQSVAAPGLCFRAQDALQWLCTTHNLEFFSRNLREHGAAIHTGFTTADWGIAETGTLIIDSRSEDLRLATMLSDIHVVFLPVARIKKDFASVEDALSHCLQSSPGYFAFITGASRTADIERVLTIGVHGPLELHVLFIEDDDHE